MEKQLSTWKVLYGKIYKVKTTINEYVYRIPNVADCENLVKVQNKKDNMAFREAVLSFILFPSQDKIYEADSEILINLILDGAYIFSDEKYKELQAIAEENITLDLFQIKLILCRHFPFLKWEDVNKMKIEDLFSLLKIFEQETQKQVISTGQNEEVSEEVEQPEKHKKRKMTAVQQEAIREAEIQRDSLSKTIKKIRGF